jgi:hypothetical protein
MSTDGNSQLERLWDAAASIIFNAIDAYGWIIPAVLLSILLLGLIALVAWWLEDLPLDPEILQGFGGIFRWTRKWWRDSRSNSTISLK